MLDARYLVTSGVTVNVYLLYDLRFEFISKFCSDAALLCTRCERVRVCRAAGRPGPGRNSEKCPLVASIGLKGKNEYAHDLNGENLEGVF